jgi:hypothetical protein
VICTERENISVDYFKRENGIILNTAINGSFEIRDGIYDIINERSSIVIFNPYPEYNQLWLLRIIDLANNFK